MISSVQLPVMAYLLPIRLYGRELDPNKKFSHFVLKQRYIEDVYKKFLGRCKRHKREERRPEKVAT